MVKYRVSLFFISSLYFLFDRSVYSSYNGCQGRGLLYIQCFICYLNRKSIRVYFTRAFLVFICSPNRKYARICLIRAYRVNQVQCLVLVQSDFRARLLSVMTFCLHILSAPVIRWFLTTCLLWGGFLNTFNHLLDLNKQSQVLGGKWMRVISQPEAGNQISPYNPLPPC